MHLKLLFFLLFIFLVRSNYVYYESYDTTSMVEAKGEDVVDACISQMAEKLSVTPNDFSLLRRLALVESNFGNNEEAVKRNSAGGIWQITNKAFEAITENQMNPGIKMLSDEIEEKFEYSCFTCEFNYSLPIRSALAARVFINYKLGDEIPSTLDEQANWWASSYHNSEKSADTYKEIVNNYEGDYKMEQKADLWFMLDGSETVTKDEFDSSLTFASSTASQCSLSMSETRCGVSVFADSNEIEQSFDDTTNYEDFETTVKAIEQPEAPLRCGNAVQEIVDEGFSQTYEERWENTENTSKCIFLILDRESTDDFEQSITNMQQQNISLFTIGIGSEINKTKLQELTKPFGDPYTCFQSNYSDLTDETTANSILDQFCNASHYTDEDVDLICVVICDSIVGNFKNSGEDTNNMEREVIEIFYVNCSNCRNYSNAESTEIMQKFQNSRGGNLITRIKMFQQRHSTSTTTTAQTTTSQTTTASTSSIINETLCGNDFKSDIWLLYDTSPGIEEDDLEKVRNFYSNMISRFNVSSETVQLGMSKFSYEHEIITDLKQPTNYADFKEHVTTVTKYPPGTKIGKAMKNVLDYGFNESHGARSENNIKKFLVMVVNENSTDDVTTAAELFKEKNITVIVIGIGGSLNGSLLDTLASEPVSKHVFRLSKSSKLKGSLSKNILETVSSSATNAVKGSPLNIEIPANNRREISITVNKNDGLSINITSNDSTATILVYVKVGKNLVNSAQFDAKFTIRNGSGNAYLKINELLENYPEITENEVDLSIAITTKKPVDLKISLGNDERDEVQKATEELDDLADECDVVSNKKNCYNLLEETLNKFNSTISSDNYKKISKKINDFKKTEIVEEAKNKTEECKTATNKTACYKELEDILEEASNLNVSVTALEESREAVENFNKQKQEGELDNNPPGNSDFQTFNWHYLWFLALALALASGICIFALVRKKKKEKVEPLEEEKKSGIEDEKISINEEEKSNKENQSQVEEKTPITEKKDVVEETKLTFSTEGPVANKGEKNDEDLEKDNVNDEYLEEDNVNDEYLEEDNVNDEIEDPIEDEIGDDVEDEEEDMDEEEIDEKWEEENLEAIEEKIKTLTEEAKLPYASFDSVQELKKALAIAEKAGIAPESLNTSKTVMKELEKKIEQEVQENIQELTERASRPGAPIECIQELKEQLEIANGLGMEAEQYNQSKDIVMQFDQKIENANSKLEKIEKVFPAEDSSKIREAEFLKSLQALKEEIDQKPEEKIFIHNSVVQKLEKSTDQAKKTFVSKPKLKKIKNQLKVAEVLEVPDEEIEDFRETAEDMEENLKSIDDAKELLKKAIEAEDTSLLEEALIQIEKLNLRVPRKDEDEETKKLKQMIGQAKIKYVKSLKNAPLKVRRQRNRKIEKLINDLEQALSSNEKEKLSKSLDNAKKRRLVLTQSPNEKKLKTLIVRAERQNKKNLKQPVAKNKETTALKGPVESSTPEPVMLQLDEIDNSPELTKLEKINKALPMAMAQMDLNNIDPDGLVSEIEKKFGKLTEKEVEDIKFNIDRYRIILNLKRSIGFRSEKMIKSALDLKDEILETTLKGYDVKGDEEMSQLINRANELRLLFEKVERMKSVVMSLKQPTISEVRSYSNPPTAIRNVMEATFLLLGEEKKKLKSWQSLKALIGKSGKDALKRRIWERDLEEIELSSAKTADSLLEGFAVEDVEVISSAGSVFYSWSACVIQEVCKRAEENKNL